MCVIKSRKQGFSDFTKNTDVEISFTYMALILLTDYVKEKRVEKYMLLFEHLFESADARESISEILAENPRKFLRIGKLLLNQFSFRSKRRLENSMTQSKTKGERISFTSLLIRTMVKFSRNEPIARISAFRADAPGWRGSIP